MAWTGQLITLGLKGKCKAMSIRPKDAHSFSLETVFQESVQVAEVAQAESLPTLVTAPSPKLQLTFTLPVLKKPVVTSVQNHTQRVLNAGFLVGGGHASIAETTRLRAVVEEVQSKLKKTQERLALTEQSVARGNAALTSERAINHARVVALTSQVKTATDAQADAQSQLKQVPSTNSAKFAIAVKGAMDASERTEELERQTNALQKELDARIDLEAEHDSLRSEHSLLSQELETAKARVAEATQTSERVRHEALLMVSDAEARALSAEEATASTLREMRNELVATQHHKAAAEQKSLEADDLIKTLDAKLALLRAELEESAAAAETAAAQVALAETAAAQVAELPAIQKVRGFERYAELKARAEEALSTGHRDAPVLHHAALQQYATLNATPDVPVFLCRANDHADAPVATPLSVHEVPLFGRGMDDVRDVFGVTKTTMRQNARTQAYVQAISTDVKAAVVARVGSL